MEDYTAEMIRDMAFSFCPQCGTAIVPNHKGRPRKFCSPECRSRWNYTHPNTITASSPVQKKVRNCGAKVTWKDNVLKGIGILLVVVGHAIRQVIATISRIEENADRKQLLRELLKG